MSKPDEGETAHQLAALLDELKPYPPREARMVSRTRARFLSQAISLRNARRHRVWTFFPRKEQLAMNLVVSTLVLLGLLFGGGTAVAAAQDDVPTDLLYPLKLASEDLRIGLESDPSKRIEMLMEQVQTRAEEMNALAGRGVVPPASVTLRMREQIRQAVQLAASLEEPARVEQYARIATRLRTQEQSMFTAWGGDCPDCDAVLQQTRELLRVESGRIEEALADPGIHRNTVENQIRNQVQATAVPPPAASDTPRADSMPAGDCPGSQDGDTPSWCGTPGPGNANGNGPEQGNGQGAGR